MNAKELGAMPAMPVIPPMDGDSSAAGYPYPSSGITLRQHFAGLFFQQFLAGAVLPPHFDAAEQLAYVAMRACEAADALLAELAKDTTP